MFQPSLRYVSTELEVCFDRARGMFRSRSTYISVVLVVCFNRARGTLTVKLEIEKSQEILKKEIHSLKGFPFTLCNTKGSRGSEK